MDSDWPNKKTENYMVYSNKIKTDIIIVNWNSGNQLKECLLSISKFNKNLVGNVIVVDNNSCDHSAKLDSKKFSFNLLTIFNKENSGFAKACNQGAAFCDSDYLLFLNPDTVLYHNSLSGPLQFMENHKKSKIGICGIQLFNRDKTPNRTCSNFPNLKNTLADILGLNKFMVSKFLSLNMNWWNHSHDKIVDQVMGAFFLVRKEVFEDLNGFDEDFFIYFEEVDFSYRAKKIGWNSYYYSKSQCFHLGGGTTKQISDLRLFFFLRSRLKYFDKHFSKLKSLIIFCATIFIEPFIRIFFCCTKFDIREGLNTIKAYKLLLKNLNN